ncbi:hypothetical protein [Yinghuangia soli]|uniref:Uncharacterized protein n=1 Tax=Yinghuangia soli TaxID=2908204 RepID=A0AA41TXC7_9ACTN|nr:hypothetical protein [Yinghuangia soli]MCF2526708.1 hypothetical protein [Yinghuangia soli]
MTYAVPVLDGPGTAGPATAIPAGSPLGRALRQARAGAGRPGSPLPGSFNSYVPSSFNSYVPSGFNSYVSSGFNSYVG